MPSRDLVVSRQHRVLVDSPIAWRMFGQARIFVPAIKLVDLPGIHVDPPQADVLYYPCCSTAMTSSGPMGPGPKAS